MKGGPSASHGDILADFLLNRQGWPGPDGYERLERLQAMLVRMVTFLLVFAASSSLGSYWRKFEQAGSLLRSVLRQGPGWGPGQR